LENRNSNRRSFIRRLVGLTALGALVALFQEKTGLPQVKAADGGYLIIGQTNTGSNTTVLTNSTSNTALQAQSTGGGNAIFGSATAASGSTFAIYGRSDGADGGGGIQGYASAASGPTRGVQGRSDSVNGTGVDGLANATTGLNYGVYGRSNSSDGVGVEGYASSPTGSTYGVYGTSLSSSGIGVFGKAGNAGAKPIVARGTSGQTANLQEWQNSAGSPLSVIDANGKLGIGIAAPARQVHLQGNNAVFRMDRDLNSSAFILVRTAAGDFNTIWKTFYVGVDASGVNDGSFFIGDVGTAVSGPSTKRLLIDNAGNVGVGTETPGYKLDVAGAVHASSFPTSSDIRFKDEVAPLGNVLERLDQVRGVSFTWNDLYTSLGRATSGRQIGVIAQEVEKAFPELVSYWSADGVDDCRAVDYGRFTAVLLEGLKELQRKVEALQAQVAELERRQRA